MWMSVLIVLSMIVILKPHALTLLEATPALVMMGMQGMVSPVKVSLRYGVHFNESKNHYYAKSVSV